MINAITSKQINTNKEEMAGLYAAIAEKRGVSLSKDQVL